ncbi:hypothetical protein SUGI_0808300 [Cryptomeria japonica]|nr:hypothetical protein SUGI_0808300 [Cryptomeria japonica]
MAPSKGSGDCEKQNATDLGVNPSSVNDAMEMSKLLLEQDSFLSADGKGKEARLTVGNLNISVSDDIVHIAIPEHFLHSRIEKLKKRAIIAKFIGIWPTMERIKRCACSTPTS